ncbi:MAG: tetratricopeptide repeat protein [Flavobacterium sp. JAD_PAG50586_2]|nr:MAG: tetratricopeptide repeat protein [Flavobacterium sp. JAD_PAG50586_2]
MRIKHIVLASAILVSVSSFAQKDELKKLKKIYEKEIPSANDLVEYKALVVKVEPLATEEGDKVYASFYKAMTPVLDANAIDKTMSPQQIQMALAKLATPKAISDLAIGLNTTLDYEKETGKKVYTDDINETIAAFKPQLIDFAMELGKINKNKEAADILYSVYTLDKKDVDLLFYAASYSVNANDFDKALEYYEGLKKLNYSGEGSIYYAYNEATKAEENFGANKKLRDVAITAKSHSKPREEKIPSKRGEIYKNIALILKEKGKTAEALTAIQDARKENPSDETLLMAEAELYLGNKDYDNYSRLVNEALAKSPNNADLVYNLGVISSNINKLDEAEKYYLKALTIDPNYFNALLNISELKLRVDEKYVTEMNKLGTSEKDNKRYEVIKSEREKNFKSILPYLEKAVELKPDDEAATKTLLSVYRALEMTDKAKALKAKM